MDVATQFHFYLLTGGNVTAAFLAQRSSEPTGPLVCPLLTSLVSFLIFQVIREELTTVLDSLRGVFTKM